jgi:hypothetical protein
LKKKIYTVRFPLVKSPEEFDFSFQPSVGEKEVLRLSSMEFIDSKEHFVFLGPRMWERHTRLLALGSGHVRQNIACSL